MCILYKPALIIIALCCLANCVKAQLCAAPGRDGTTNADSVVNTYFTTPGPLSLSAGSNNIALAAVMPPDGNSNNYGTVPVSIGDLLIIIQMQDATIDYSNTELYGGGINNSGNDRLGGTGFVSPGNSGKYEYLVATSNVPLTGGLLTFKGLGVANGTVNDYFNANETASRGKRTFQVIRVPQYANLSLSSNITTPLFNGTVGGIIAIDVAETMKFNGYNINAAAKGFRGGYNLTKAASTNVDNVYVTNTTDARTSGKGEGIAGTPRYVWDGVNANDNGVEGLPGGSAGKGAAANAGGGGNAVNAGGGGGGNAGDGGVGGWGNELYGGTYPDGGRPGAAVYSFDPITIEVDGSRLMMGGGGGGGYATDGVTSAKGGVGGGIVLINTRAILDSGYVLVKGGAGQPGIYTGSPDGSGGGGGGAGGTIFFNIFNTLSTTLYLDYNGGAGGNTVNDDAYGVMAHGPGGGGGGGLLLLPYSSISQKVVINYAAAKAGKTNNGAGTTHNAENAQGLGRNTAPKVVQPPYLIQHGLDLCYPELATTMSVAGPINPKTPGSEVVYSIKIVNTGSGGSASGVQADCLLPPGFTYKTSKIVYSGLADGPDTLTNYGTDNRPVLGNFNIPAGDEVTITLTGIVGCVAAGTYNASTQAIYLDPTRNNTDPDHRSTAAIQAIKGSNTVYEGSKVSFQSHAAVKDIPGNNYDGSKSTAEDVKVINLPPIANNTIAQPNPDAVTCALSIDPYIINGSVATGGSGVYIYQWQSSTDNITFTDIIGANSINYDPPVITETTYYRRAVTSGTCVVPLNSNIITMIVNTVPVVNAGGDKEILINDKIQLDGSAQGANLLYHWSPETYLDNPDILNPVASPVSDIVYTLTVTSPQGCYVVSDNVTVRVYPNLNVPNTFTPNGDGINDTWEIKELSLSSKCIVSIFNRYGTLIYRSMGYSKPWDGTYNGKVVPFGNYYYTIDLKNGSKIFSGSLTIIK